MVRDAKKESGHTSGTFLVRFWVEPAADQSEPALRGTVKNLKTGQEQLLNDPGSIGDVVLRYLEEDPRGASRELLAPDSPPARLR